MAYKIHAVMYPKKSYTYHQAYHSMTKDYADNSPIDHYTNYPNFWRFTTIYTKEWLKRNGYTKYRTKVLPNGIQLSICYK